jgi:hypothetical protein
MELRRFSELILKVENKVWILLIYVVTTNLNIQDNYCLSLSKDPLSNIFSTELEIDNIEEEKKLLENYLRDSDLFDFSIGYLTENNKKPSNSAFCSNYSSFSFTISVGPGFDHNLANHVFNKYSKYPEVLNFNWSGEFNSEPSPNSMPDYYELNFSVRGK